MDKYNPVLKMNVDSEILENMLSNNNSSVFGFNISGISLDHPIFGNSPIYASDNFNDKYKNYAPSCQYKKWTIPEIDDLIYMYDIGYSLKEMCNELLRTPKGIAAKLVRLGKISYRGEILDQQQIENGGAVT